MTILDTPQTETKVLGWHFLREDRCLGNRDGRMVEAGETLSVDCKPSLCESGMHASVRAIDALRYAPGPVVCRVELWGDIKKGQDKVVGTHRRCLEIDDANDLLHEFSCWCAENALTRWEKRSQKNADKRSWNAIQTKRDWLKGKASDEELAAARAAAWDAAWDAARHAARAAAWDDEIERQNQELESRLLDLLGLGGGS